MAAPATAIIGYDLDFYELLPRLFPRSDMRKAFVGKPDLFKDTAFRNSLQGAYFILALRSLV
jgi:3-hydroxypropanoate dehydrogenase